MVSKRIETILHLKSILEVKRVKKTDVHTIPIKDLLTKSTAAYIMDTPFPDNRLSKIPLWKKIWNEKRLERLLKTLKKDLHPYISEFKAYAEPAANRDNARVVKLKELVIDTLEKIDEKKLLFDQPFLTYFLSQGYMDAAERFLLKAETDDAQLSHVDIFQAMRNVWIMNSLQLYWGNPVKVTAPMYAYSMLYPYTDNLLDNPEIDTRIKKAFNQRLSKALSGEKVDACSDTEKRIFILVDEIFEQFPKNTFPAVTESIQLIHKAQVESLKQAADKSLSEDDILKISLFKGGTSVLADAFLLTGSLNREQMVFSFHYGAFLQLLDDLQDKESDLKEQTQTRFTIRDTQESMDNEITKLIAYIYKVNSPDSSDDQTKARLKDIISRCTLIMVMESVGKNPGCVTPAFYRKLESYSKVRLKTYRALQEQIESIMESIV